MIAKSLDNTVRSRVKYYKCAKYKLVDMECECAESGLKGLKKLCYFATGGACECDWGQLVGMTGFHYCLIVLFSNSRVVLHGCGVVRYVMYHVFRVCGL